eukprot:GILI01022778.1.p2 GENE.GILI01022778.1~~GILI01022778.1.p2  ORF type:complete len:140 (-),score=25.24 GILI01022778.1:89-508(-)
MAGTKAVIKISAMKPDIEQDCVDAASHALLERKLVEQRAIAQFIKRELDSKYGPTWHVIVGRSFGSYLSHDDQNFVYFFIGDCGFLIWRTESLPTKIVDVGNVLEVSRQKKMAAAENFARVFGDQSASADSYDGVAVGE